MNETKIRIGTHVVNQTRIESELRNAIIAINAPLREAIESIGFESSEELFKDCLDGGRAITQQYYERLNKELSILTIPSSKVLFEQSAKEGLKKFHTVRQDVVNKYGLNASKYISFENDFAVFSEESRKQLDEDCAVYIVDPEEIELYNLHVEACKALNNFFQGHKSLVWNQMFDFENGRFKPGMINYDVLLTNIKRAKENGN